MKFYQFVLYNIYIKSRSQFVVFEYLNCKRNRLKHVAYTHASNSYGNKRANCSKILEKHSFHSHYTHFYPRDAYEHMGLAICSKPIRIQSIVFEKKNIIKKNVYWVYPTQPILYPFATLFLSKPQFMARFFPYNR